MNYYNQTPNLQGDSSYFGSYSRPLTSTLDRHYTRPNSSIPSRSLSSQHITSSSLGGSGLGSSALTSGNLGSTALAGGALSSSTRSPSMRRMRHLLELEQGRMGNIPNPSPVPTPSSTLPRNQRQIDINPAGKQLT